MAASDSVDAFVNMKDLPEESRTWELCNNQYSTIELNVEKGYAIYPVRFFCGHVFCYDCSRVWISHAKCPDCDARFQDWNIALANIDAQIQQYNQFGIACFNAHLEAGLIRAPPGYPTFAGQQDGPSGWWHEDDEVTASGGPLEPQIT